MDDTIRTARLTIRRVRADDWQAVRSIWAEVSKTSLAQYDNPKPVDDAAVSARIEMWGSFVDSTAHMFFAVCLDGVMIGYVTLHDIGCGHELGYCFHPAYHGRGYAGESIRALLTAAKALHISRIEAGTALDNAPSVALLTKLGFRRIRTEAVSFYRDADGNDIVFPGGVYELLL